MDTLLLAFGAIAVPLLALIFVLVILYWPVLIFYAVWRLLRDVRRITNAIEHVVYEAPRMRRDIVKATEERAEKREPGVVNSAFGR